MSLKGEALGLADAMEGRARIRRQAKDRLSVQEGANDRLSDQLEQASDIIRKLVNELKIAEDTYALLHGIHFKPNPQIKRRSDEEIKDLYMKMFGRHISLEMIAFTREIEEMYGIKFPEQESLPKNYAKTEEITRTGKQLSDDKIIELVIGNSSASHSGYEFSKRELFEFARALLKEVS